MTKCPVCNSNDFLGCRRNDCPDNTQPRATDAEECPSCMNMEHLAMPGLCAEHEPEPYDGCMRHMWTPGSGACPLCMDENEPKPAQRGEAPLEIQLLRIVAEQLERWRNAWASQDTSDAEPARKAMFKALDGWRNHVREVKE